VRPGRGALRAAAGSAGEEVQRREIADRAPCRIACLPPGVTARRITGVLRRLDGLVREIRNHTLAERGRNGEPDPAWSPLLRVLERSAQAKDQPELLQRQVAQTARAVQSAAADTAALLERRAELAGQPGRIDYPTEIKRWRALADQAGQIAGHRFVDGRK